VAFFKGFMILALAVIRFVMRRAVALSRQAFSRVFRLFPAFHCDFRLAQAVRFPDFTPSHSLLAAE
jgi:hypothetical protein